MNIIEAISDSQLFGPLFKDLETWRGWMVFLRGLFALPIEGAADRKLYREGTGLQRFVQPSSPSSEAYVIVGRRGGKSFISSLIAVFLGCFHDWRPYLTKGEQAYIFLIANDRFQARNLKSYISGILESQPLLKRMVLKDLTWEIHLQNQVVISIKTASYRTVRGYSVACCILEELAFWRSEEFANPDREIIAALRPSMSTIPGSLLLGISTPYSRSGVLYDAHKRYYGKSSSGPLVWQAHTLRMNPTISIEAIRRDFEDDPVRAEAEWNAVFRSDVESFLPRDVVEAAVVPGRFELPKIPDAKYRGFVDPSGGRQDSMCLGIAHREKSENIVLDVVRERRPPFKPSDVVEEFASTLKAYGISTVESDRYAGEWVSSAFRDCGITVKNSELNKSEIYLEFLPMLQNGSLELLDSKRLTGQLCNLERKTRSGGRDSVDHPPKLAR